MKLVIIFSRMVFCLLISLLFTQTIDAQLLQRAIKRGVDRAVERKVEREAEKQTEKALDSLFKESEKSPTEASDSAKAAEDTKRSMAMMQRMMGGINNADLPSSYDYKHEIVWEVEDEKGEKSNMVMYFMPDAANIGMKYIVDKKKPEEQLMVMDYEGEFIAMFMDNDGQKSSMTLPISQEVLLDAAEKSVEEENSANYSIEKTGRTKSILGYHCEEYIVTTDDYIQNTWVTEEVEVGNTMQGFFKQMLEKNKRMGEAKMANGFPMEMEMKRKKNGKMSYIRTISIEEVDFTIKTADYPAMGIGQ